MTAPHPAAPGREDTHRIAAGLPGRTGWFDAHVRSGRHPERPLGTGDAAAIRDHLVRFGFSGALVGATASWLHDPLTGNAEASAVAAELADLGALPCWTAVPATPGESGDPAELVDRAAAEGVAAFRLFPDTHRFSLNDRGLDGCYAALIRHRLPLWLDLAEAGWSGVDVLLTRFPELTVVVSQLGYRELRHLVPFLRRHSGLRVDLVNLATHQVLEWLHRHGLADRVIFGSGFGVRDATEAVFRLAGSGLDPETVAAIGRGNAARLWPALAPGADDTGPEVGGTAGDIEVIDAHAHLGPYSRFFIPDPDADTMIDVMDRVGSSVAVLSSNLAIQQDAAKGNAATLAAVDAHPDRLAGYAVINPWQDPAEQLARVDQDERFVGIKLHPSLHAYPVTGARYAAVWEFSHRTGCPVLSHTDVASPWDAPRLFAEVCAEYDQAKIIFGHSGIAPAGIDEAIEVARDHPHTYLELCGSQLVGPLITDMVNELGAERVLFGSDFPFIDHRLSLGRVLGTDLPTEAKRDVLGGSARRLFSWRPLPRPSSTAGGRR